MSIGTVRLLSSVFSDFRQCIPFDPWRVSVDASGEEAVQVLMGQITPVLRVREGFFILKHSELWGVEG
jgi:hypothetical protein